MTRVSLISNQMVPHFNMKDALHAVFSLRHMGCKNLDFSDVFDGNTYRMLTSARAGLRLLLHLFQIPKTQKIALPAYICAVVATPILAAGYTIKWIETDAWGNMDTDDLETKMENVGAVVLPSIFGQMPDVKRVSELCKEYGAKLVFDGAHGYDLSYMNQVDAMILSFGREKVISCVSGGAVLLPKESPYTKELKDYKIQKATTRWTVHHALQPLMLVPCLEAWRVGGRYLSAIIGKLKLLPRAVTQNEKKGKWDAPMATLPTVQQHVLQRQFDLFAVRNHHAKEMAQYWKEQLLIRFMPEYVRVPENEFRVLLRTEWADLIRTKAKAFAWDLRDWDGEPIAPKGVDLLAFDYTPGQCPVAEHVSQTLVTLPTHMRVTKDRIDIFLKTVFA